MTVFPEKLNRKTDECCNWLEIRSLYNNIHTVNNTSNKIEIK